jgi:hypothetical protein
MKTFSHLLQYLAKFYLEWEIVYTKIVDNNKHTFYVQKTFSENRAVYGIMSKNTLEPERPQITIYYGAYALHAG